MTDNTTPPASGPVAEAARRAAEHIANEQAGCKYDAHLSRDYVYEIIAAEFQALEAAAEAMATGLDKIALDQEAFTSQDDFDKWIADLRAARLAYRSATLHEPRVGQAGSGQAGK